ncbi:protein FAM98B [Bactrocera dorsalis]|uniref:Protein FAM98B n=1 Tax=Bactrocera dorsalis TaxID=27457 RepID=A0A6I9VEF9_BACDO|nr:protein FAM98B [Bactrocera dorsalis]
MRSFILITLLLALTSAFTRAQLSFPGTQQAFGGNNRYPRNPAQQSAYGITNPNSIDSPGSRYPTQSGLGNAGYGAGSSSLPGQAGIGASPPSAANGNPNNRILGLLGGGGGGGGGGLFSNLIGALTGRNRPGGAGGFGGGAGAGGFGGGAYPYPVPVPYPGYSPYGPPSPYGGAYGYPGFGGGYYG